MPPAIDGAREARQSHAQQRLRRPRRHVGASQLQGIATWQRVVPTDRRERELKTLLSKDLLHALSYAPAGYANAGEHCPVSRASSSREAAISSRTCVAVTRVSSGCVRVCGASVTPSCASALSSGHVSVLRDGRLGQCSVSHSRSTTPIASTCGSDFRYDCSRAHRSPEAAREY